MKSDKEKLIENMLCETKQFDEGEIEESAKFVVDYIDACMSIVEDFKKMDYSFLKSCLTPIKESEK